MAKGNRFFGFTFAGNWGKSRIVNKSYNNAVSCEMFRLNIAKVLALVSALGVSACTYPDGSPYNGGTGALVGAGYGAIVGRAVGGDGRGAVVGGIIGATIGGLVGDATDQQVYGY